MCTVSWLSWPDGFDLFFNRDESRVRGRGEAPQLHTTPSGVRYLAPRDPDAGGTWIVVNEYGTAACLLNRYPAEGAIQRSRPGASRGEIVRDVADARDAGDVEQRLRARDLGAFQPFTVLTIDADSRVKRMVWDARDLTRDPHPEMPLASSGHSPATVEATRRAVWRAMDVPLGVSLDVPDDRPARTDRLLAFHQSHQPRRGALSPCMHRIEARTVSLCHVGVSASCVTMAYADGAPCRTPLSAPLALARGARRVSA